MGEVYRARDSRLKREVALKVLSQAAAQDADRVARFHREAEVLAALSHPHIAAIYDVAYTSDIPAIAMELVPGETLAERIKRSRIPVHEAVRIARQIAEALDAAHDRGVIHRDLKPANIKITPDGVVKVLDFGLARLAEVPGRSQKPAASDDGATTSPAAITEHGMVLGTAPYMAPEQASGKAVDKRADIWAFGCVLFEMLTGQRAFQGHTLAETLGAVLYREPDWHSLPAGASRNLRALLLRCLQKDPGKRLRDIGDGMWELDAQPTAGRLVERIPGWIPWAVALVLGIAAVAGWLRTTTGTPSVPSLTSTLVPQPGSVLGNMALEIAPDASAVAFLATAERTRGLYVRRLDSLEDELIPGSTELNGPPIWSPDSTTIVFPTARGLTKVRLPDGAPEPLTPASGPNPALIPRGGTWSDDGTIVTTSRGILFAVPAGGGEAREIGLGALKPGLLGGPQFVSGENDLLFLLLPADGGEPEIYLATLRGDQIADPVLLFTNETEARFTPAGGGRLLFIRNDNLYSQKLNVGARRLEGDPELVVSNVRSSPSVSGAAAAFSVSRSGVLAWRPGRAERAHVTMYDRRSQQTTTVGMPDTFDSVVLSPDETRLLVHRPSRAWVLDIGQTGRQSTPGGIRWFAWSRDSKLLGLQSQVTRPINPATDQPRLVEHPANGSAEVRVVGSFLDTFSVPQDISPDERDVLGVTPEGTAIVSGRASGTADERRPRALIQTGQQVNAPRFSPDGRWVMYAERETVGGGAIYVQPFPGPGRRKQVAAEGRVPEWRRDGREIVYLIGDTIWSVSVEAKANELSFGAPQQLMSGFRIPPGATLASRPLAVTRDGLRIFAAQAVDQPDTNVIHVKLGAAQ